MTISTRFTHGKLCNISVNVKSDVYRNTAMRHLQIFEVFSVFLTLSQIVYKD